MVVSTDPEGRFEGNGNQIRATYGHFVDVELESLDSAVPSALFHGTAQATVDAILDEGLRPMDCQHVHLPDTKEEAHAMGERHAVDPVLLRADAAGLVRERRDRAR